MVMGNTGVQLVSANEKLRFGKLCTLTFLHDSNSNLALFDRYYRKSADSECWLLACPDAEVH
jgi:hypothetical protein